MKQTLMPDRVEGFFEIDKASMKFWIVFMNIFIC